MNAESILTVMAAILLACVFVFVTRLKLGFWLRVFVNSVCGMAVFIGFAAFGVLDIPVNLLTAALVGLLGLPGFAAVIAVAFIL